ncbi:unnamed protein product [Vitrella brassicaformis CCMP3155]|uniref:Uncharacterized protein n=1 Tax=Vitrella brassicaformis (strain CCMP3155) TaxID=1169540 RepID=A0A0G4FSL2_VITBC|nr:unnamed protein product [Vitrella brassicaformis CCMP3155]|mmetsp:Transcript_19476/g.55810  ORF Transcript_19476/g.55810 Transcript_19476/m.55810 type:complete len:251 (+) Transcript_19476:132-884(+)|eukprot:CEM17696.1 unnamed protein product [Vitrella brassicaformis CCMP3155]
MSLPYASPASQPLTGVYHSLDDTLRVEIRHSFIKKVYGILAAQLAVTFVLAASLTSAAALAWLQSHPAILFMAIVVQLGLCISFMCCPHLLRQYPTNYILLGLFTVAEGFLIGVVCAVSDPAIVLVALSLTLGIVIGLTLFAFQTKYDFTSWAPYLFVVALGFFLTGLMMGIMGMFGVHIKLLHILYCGFGVILFSIYLVFDTQMIVGAKHARFEFSVDDYCFAALMLYIDIIQIFLYLLRLLQMLRSSD